MSNPLTGIHRRSAIGAILALGLILPVAAPALATPSVDLVLVANDYRAGAGVTPVSTHHALLQIASERSEQMAAANELEHDLDYVTQRMADLGVCWQAYGEIIAMHGGQPEPDTDRFGQQWYNSAPHRGIMLDANYNVAGGGVATASNGRHYGTMIFARTCGGSGGSPIAGFTDIGSSPFQADIAWLVSASITDGCAPGRFCPSGEVSREQMASFMARAMSLSHANQDYFSDDGGSIHQADINRVAQASVTAGCTSARYCPSVTVTRGQMAAFLVRALNLPAAGGDYFWDDNGSIFGDPINRLAAAGVTGGCGGGRFCPDEPVTREQMAAFLHRAFGP